MSQTVQAMKETRVLHDSLHGLSRHLGYLEDPIKSVIKIYSLMIDQAFACIHDDIPRPS